MDPAKEVVEVDWVVEEASARRQRVESPELVLHLVEEGATTTITYYYYLLLQVLL